MNYTYRDIVHALKESGLSYGDTVFFTTSLGLLGIPPENIKTSDALNQMFFDAIKDVLGKDGTILIPTYSYTFGKSSATNLAIFDKKTTMAEIGSFPNFFLKQKNVKRTLDPMMSIAGIGPKCKELFKNLEPTSYGEGSFFSKLVKSDAKCCSIGLGPNWTPFIHYADWLHHVPFRFDKLFYGSILKEAGLEKTTWLYSVRILANESLPNAHTVGRLAEKEGIWKPSNLGRARIYTANIQSYFDFVVNHLVDNKWLLAKGPSGDVLTIEKQRVNFNYAHRIFNDFSKNSWKKQLSSMRIDLISDGFENILIEIQKEFGGTIFSYLSGTWFHDFIVPEKWTLKNASLIDIRTNTELLNPSNKVCVKTYSMSFNGIIDLKTLQEHTNITQTFPDFVERDWGFCADDSFLDSLQNNNYLVNIESDFSFGELKYLEIEAQSEDVFICYIRANTIEELLNMLDSLNYHRQHVVFVSGYIGFLSWLSTRGALKKSIHHVGFKNEIIRGGNPMVKAI